MKFGKLNHLQNVDFRLPVDAESTQLFLSQKLGTSTAPKLYIGCTGWSMKEWVGSVYPSDAKSKDYLKHYTRQFNTIELNTTHYAIPSSDTVQKWYSESPSDFRFCPKIPQSISHSRNLGLGTGQVPLFCEVIALLREKLGCCFIQLPPHFSLDKIELLTQFLQGFPSEIPLAVEVRHSTWFETAAAREQFLALLQQYQRVAVITDVAGRRDVLHMGISAPQTMIRFVGNGLDKTDFERIDEWAQRLKEWYDNGLESAYFFTHEPDNILAPQLSAYLWQVSQIQLPHVRTRGPNISSNNNQEGQLSLF
ncbi:MAG TPA: DUF72 domain-containing protein [Saprospiraceae bacterium]|nr:DUF72 domain-containing protein [Saprospiraceae bacterium]HMQ83553.1 DUF72 domain-containing protein [Saprospiraceae bacterium]